MWWRRVAAAGVLAALVAGCPAPDTSSPVPPSQGTPGPPERDPDPAPPPEEPIAEPDVGDDDDDDPAPRAPRAAGEACDRASDCESGVCEGIGCGPGEGVCAPARRGCTRDLVSYCSCEGETFQSSGSCPGRRYAYRGACGEPRADGSPCAAEEQCESGICEGQGCGDEETGRCVPAGRACTADVAEYCGCGGATFTASGSCPGRRYRHRGACK